MAEVIHVTSENFDQATSKGVCLLDFWAEWCGPCKMLSPVLDQVAAEIGDRALILKADVDNVQQQTVKFGVRNIPAIFILKDGAVVKQFNGVQDKATLVKAIEDALDA